MAKTWKVNVDGTEHEISYKKGVFKTLVIVDGIETRAKSKSAALQLIDEPIVLGSKTLHLTAIGATIDLAVDNVYVNSKKPYVALSNVPSWANVISILLLISGWFFGGIIGILIGLFGGMFVISKSLSFDKSNPLPLCLVITVVCIAMQFAYFTFLRNVLL